MEWKLWKYFREGVPLNILWFEINFIIEIQFVWQQRCDCQVTCEVVNRKIQLSQFRKVNDPINCEVFFLFFQFFTLFKLKWAFSFYFTLIFVLKYCNRGLRVWRILKGNFDVFYSSLLSFIELFLNKPPNFFHFYLCIIFIVKNLLIYVKVSVWMSCLKVKEETKRQLSIERNLFANTRRTKRRKNHDKNDKIRV